MEVALIDTYKTFKSSGRFRDMFFILVSNKPILQLLPTIPHKTLHYKFESYEAFKNDTSVFIGHVSFRMFTLSDNVFKTQTLCIVFKRLTSILRRQNFAKIILYFNSEFVKIRKCNRTTVASQFHCFFFLKLQCKIRFSININA